jgi:hypothetical protein
VDGIAPEQAIYQALKAAGEVAAALQVRLIESTTLIRSAPPR